MAEVDHSVPLSLGRVSHLNLTPLNYADYRDAPRKPDNLFYSPIWTLTQTYALRRVHAEGYLTLLLGEKPLAPSPRSFVVQEKAFLGVVEVQKRFRQVRA